MRVHLPRVVGVALTVATVLALSGCGSDPAPAADGAAGTPVDGTADADADAGAGGAAEETLNVDWERNAFEFRGRDGDVVALRCPAEGIPQPVWGTDVYTDDSSVCTAGAHAGVITVAEGGTVTIVIEPGRSEYVGSSRNGIDSSDWEAHEGSFRVQVPEKEGEG